MPEQRRGRPSGLRNKPRPRCGSAVGRSCRRQATQRADSTKKTGQDHPRRQPPPVATAVPKKPTAIAMQAAQSMIRAPIRAPSSPATLDLPVASQDAGRDSPRSPRPCPALSATWLRLPGAPTRDSRCSQPWQAPCYMRETFAQLDRNRISIRLPKQPRVEHRSARPALLAQRP